LIRKRQPIIESDQFTRIRIENPIRDPLLRKRLDLMFLWGWATGLRAKEVVGISIRCIRKSILDEVQVNTRPSVIKLDVLRMFQTTTSDVFMMDLVPPTTKGGRGGSILVPREIVKATAEWINSSRRFLKIRHEASDCVFIAAHCGSIEPETLEKYFTTAAKRCCVKGSFHSLRHSYATRMTSEFNRLGCPALGALIVQNQLRHGARETTANYVHAAEMQAHAGAVHLAVNRAFL
jgi:integrase